MNRFDGVIFDLDGTLIDSNTVWERIDKQVLAQYGVFPEERELHRAAAMTYEEVLQLFIGYGINITLDEMKKRFDTLAEIEYANNITLKSGVKDYLHALKSGNCPIALATASPKRLYEPVLRNNGIYDMFDAFVTTDEVGKSKDYPDIYIEAAKRLGADTDRCIVFEDTLKAITTAARAGIYTVAVYDSCSSADEAAIRQTADRYIVSFEEMCER